MSTLHVAVPELRRMAPDALRMIGVPLGQADETADMFVWSEVATANALRFLRVNRARLLSVPRPRAVLESNDGETVRVNARGASLLEHGIRVFDFIRSAAFDAPVTATVSNTYGALFLPYLVWRGEHFGYRVRVTDPSGGELGTNPDERRIDVHVQMLRIGDAESRALSDPTVAPEPHRRALDTGLDVDADDFTAFNQLFEMLRVPTSERSRSHAG